MFRTPTASLLHRPGNPGTKGRLLAKSVEAYLLALETINRLTVTYRVETFCALVCNAWELLLKAKILEDSKDRKAIWYPEKAGGRRKSISLRDATKRVFLNESDTTRRNLERVEELRDEAIHLFISEVPKDVLGLLQACVLNYHRCLNDWFGVALADRVPVGMMTIVFDISPERLDLSDATMRRRLGKDAADYLLTLTTELRDEHAALGGSEEFSVEIKYGLTIERKGKHAAIVAVTGNSGAPARIIRTAKDPGIDYPFLRTDMVAELNRVIRPKQPITSGDVQAVVAAHNVKKQNEWFYQGTVRNSPAQYATKFVEWFAARYRSDPKFLDKAKQKYRQQLALLAPSARRRVPRNRPPDRGRRSSDPLGQCSTIWRARPRRRSATGRLIGRQKLE